MNKSQPNADTIGRELESKGFVEYKGNRFYQTSDNCFEIACYLADKLGYYHPADRKKLGEAIRHSKDVQLGWASPSSYDRFSEACLVIRTPDSVSAPFR